MVSDLKQLFSNSLLHYSSVSALLQFWMLMLLPLIWIAILEIAHSTTVSAGN
jgi:hypothetical protein